jgi:hypothetical protein
MPAIMVYGKRSTLWPPGGYRCVTDPAWDLSNDRPLCTDFSSIVGGRFCTGEKRVHTHKTTGCGPIPHPVSKPGSVSRGRVDGVCGLCFARIDHIDPYLAAAFRHELGDRQHFSDLRAASADFECTIQCRHLA